MTSFLTGAPPPKKNPGSAPDYLLHIIIIIMITIMITIMIMMMIMIILTAGRQTSWHILYPRHHYKSTDTPVHVSPLYPVAHLQTNPSEVERHFPPL